MQPEHALQHKNAAAPLEHVLKVITRAGDSLSVLQADMMNNLYGLLILHQHDMATGRRT